MTDVQAPKMVEKDTGHGKTYEHPAFGQIRVNRVSGREPHAMMSFSPFGDLLLPVELVHPQANVAMLGHLPCWLDPADASCAVQQFDEHYRRFGGWREVIGWAMIGKGQDCRLKAVAYPSDPERPLLAKMQLRDETVLFFTGGYTAVQQPDGSLSIARMD